MQAVGRSAERYGQVVEQVFLLVVGHCAGGGGGGVDVRGEVEVEVEVRVRTAVVVVAMAVVGQGRQSRACRQRRLTRRSARGARVAANY